MSDAAVMLEASDIFALGGNFIPQNGSVVLSQEHGQMLKANGDFELWSDPYNKVKKATCTYRYNTTTGLGAALPNVGKVSGGFHIDQFTVKTTYNDYPEITIEGHQHIENEHADDRVQYSMSSGMESIFDGAFGAYDLAGLASDPICVTGSSVTVSVNHIDAECGEGDHWVGNNVQGIEKIQVDYIGLISASATISGYTITDITTPSDSNTEHDKSSISAEKYLARVV